MPETISKPQEINWTELGQEFEDASSEEILAHALNELSSSGPILFLTAFGPEGCVLIAMLHQLLIEKRINKRYTTNKTSPKIGKSIRCPYPIVPKIEKQFF